MSNNLSYEVEHSHQESIPSSAPEYTEHDEIKTTLVSRNITVMGRRTSIRLEPEMWMGLKEIAERENCSVHDICSLVSLRKREKTSLTAAIRVFLMLYFRAAATSAGHERAGHGAFENMVRRAKLCDELLPQMNNKKPVPYGSASSFVTYN